MDNNKTKIYIPPGENKFYVQAILLSKVVERILRKRGEIYLKTEPELKRGEIIQFMKRMRVSGLSKFDEKTFVSYVNFYRTEKEMHKNKPVGAIVVYIPESYVYRLMQKLDYPVQDEGDRAGLLDACGTFANLVAGNFKSGLIQIGYSELSMSHFSSFENEVLDGVPFDSKESQYFEVGFEIERERRIVVDLTLGKIQHEFEVEDWSFFKDEEESEE